MARTQDGDRNSCPPFPVSKVLAAPGCLLSVKGCGIRKTGAPSS